MFFPLLFLITSLASSAGKIDSFRKQLISSIAGQKFEDYNANGIKDPEDLGVSGSISVTERAFSQMSGIPSADRFELTISGIPLRGVFLS